jgi:hypothetical protein
VKVVNLYTGNGVSLSPHQAEGRVLSSYVRLIAEDCMGITDGDVVHTCIDIPSVQINRWVDCPAPDDGESHDVQ